MIRIPSTGTKAPQFSSASSWQMSLPSQERYAGLEPHNRSSSDSKLYVVVNTMHNIIINYFTWRVSTFEIFVSY